MKKILVLFVEITQYNLARIENVYERIADIEFTYVYCHRTVSGHEASDKMPKNSYVLDKSARMIGSMLRMSKWDFIIINGYVETACVMAILFAKMKHIPYAIETDTQLNVPQNKLKKIFKRRFLKFVFSGKAYGFAGGTLQKDNFKYYGMPDTKIYLMPMTVDVDFFHGIASEHSKDYYKKKYGYYGKKLIIYVGRFAEEKNIPFLIKSFYNLSKKYNDIQLCLIGKGILKEELHQIIEELGIGPIVDIIPYQKTDVLAEYYSLCDVFVLPSIYEPWGLVVNEALACGVPVLVSDKVGCRIDLIRNGLNGDVFSLDSTKELERYLEHWLFMINHSIDINLDNWTFEKYKALFQSALEDIDNNE